MIHRIAIRRSHGFRLVLFRFCGIVGLVFVLSCPLTAQTAERSETAESIYDEAETLIGTWSAVTYDRSTRSFVQAADAFEKDSQLEKAANSLRRAAQNQLSVNPRFAIELARRSLALEKKLGSPEGVSASLSLLSLASLKSGQIIQGSKFADDALAMANKSGSAASIGRALLASAEAKYERQDFREMLNLQKMALHYFRTTPELEDDANCLQAVAFSDIINNNPTLGIQAATEATALADRIGSTRLKALSLIVLGEGLSRVGEWRKAIESLREAESIFPEDVDLFERSILLNRIGKYYMTFGDFRSAKGYLERSLTLFQRLGNESAVAEISTVLGSVCVELGDDVSAANYYSTALADAKAQGLPTAVGLIHEKIGETFVRKHQYKSALQYFRKALTSFRRTGIKHAIARVSRSIGITEFQNGDHHDSEHTLRTALSLSREVSNVESTDECLFFLAQIDQKNGLIDRALKESSESLELNERLQAQPQIQKLRSSYRSNSFDRYALNIQLLMEMAERTSERRFAVAALQTAERSRASVLRESLTVQREGRPSDDDPDVMTRENELLELLNTRSNGLTELLVAKSDQTAIDTAVNEINSAENEIEELRAKARERTSTQPQEAPEFDVASFQQNVLDEDDVFLEFALGPDRSYVWLIDKANVVPYNLPSGSQLEPEIASVLELLKAREIQSNDTPETYNARVADAEMRYPAAAAVLSKDLLAPVADRIPGKRLIISPEGNLQYLPLGALPIPNSNVNAPLILSNDVEYAPSALTLSVARSNENKRVPDPSQKDLLVLSDPVFSTSDARLARSSELDAQVPSVTLSRSAESIVGLQRLVASQTESRILTDMLPDSVSLEGFSANRAAILNEDLSKFKVLHFATHGVMNQKYPELSGILLSLYDENGESSDGFLRSNDIYGMHLNSDLVVLSACSTGVGKDLRGEGILGLNTAFLRAGASSVVSTLWKVDDNATEDLMRGFYSGMVTDGLNPGTALRNSQIRLMQDDRYRSPYYWAAFTIQGDPSKRIVFSQKSRSVYPVLLIAFSLVVVCALGYRLRRRFTRIQANN